MAKVDSIDKIVGSYFAAVTREPFFYKSKRFEPRTLHVSPLLFRGYTCPARCGGCCFRFSLDYLPHEDAPAGVAGRVVEFDGRAVLVFSDMQDDHDGHFCRHLHSKTGRCGVYAVRPFSCDFELIRFMVPDEGTEARLSQKLYGRGWNFTRVDGDKGALCEMTEPTADTIAEVVRKLHRLEDWCLHFGVRHHRVGEIVAWAEGRSTLPRTRPLVLDVAAPSAL